LCEFLRPKRIFRFRPIFPEKTAIDGNLICWIVAQYGTAAGRSPGVMLGAGNAVPCKKSRLPPRFLGEWRLVSIDACAKNQEAPIDCEPRP
jgi:hypothetical protein